MILFSYTDDNNLPISNFEKVSVSLYANKCGLSKKNVSVRQSSIMYLFFVNQGVLELFNSCHGLLCFSVLIKFISAILTS